MTAPPIWRALLAVFLSHFKKFSSFFNRKQHHAHNYLKGLIQTDKRNMERIEEKIPEAGEQGLQYFLSDSSWEEEPIFEEIAAEADQLLGGKDDSALYIDETGFPKKGKKSVGVARQWSGQLGKVDNCQVGVFSSLGHGKFACPIGYKLYLPNEWIKDSKRCRKAKIPAEHYVDKSKHDLAFELIQAARQNNVRFNWIGADRFYGKNPAFLRDIDRLGETFVINVDKFVKTFICGMATKKASYSRRGIFNLFGVLGDVVKVENLQQRRR